MKTHPDIKALKHLNLSIKVETTKALLHLGYGHFGGCLSITETLACLYGHYLKHNPQNPHWPERDYFVLSKGHAGPALYATLAQRGYFETSLLKTINSNGTQLPSHADMNLTPGVDMTTGSLGQGISCAVGMALSKPEKSTYCIVGDGELQEGQCWEAIQLAAHKKLSNLVVFVDNNKRQLDGFLADIQTPFNLADKFNAFGFQTLAVDGADITAICNAIEQAHNQKDKPTAIILDTEKGQGFPSIVSIASNHHLRLDASTRKAIEADLSSLEKQMEELV